MDPVGTAVGAVGLVVMGVVVHLVTRAASSGGIEVNGVVGIRTRLTTSSQEAWVAAHRAALPLTRLGCVLATTAAGIGVAAAVAASTLGTGGAVSLVVLAAGYLAFVVVLLLTVRWAHRAVRALS